MHLLFLLTHYNNTAEVSRFLEHIVERCRAGDGIIPHFSICDNSGGLERNPPEPDRPSASCLLVTGTSHNSGYLAGCRLACRAFSKTHPEIYPDWICISNTDIVVAEPFFTVLQKLQPGGHVGVLAPDIRLADGRRQNPFLRKRLPVWRMQFYLLLTRFPLCYNAYARFRRVTGRWRAYVARGQKTPDPVTGWPDFDAAQAGTERDGVGISEGETIYAPHGSAFFLHPEFFRRGGELPQETLMYHEEIAIAEEARAHDLKIRYVPALRIRHHHHSTTGNERPERTVRKKHEALCFLYERYYRSGRFAGKTDDLQVPAREQER